MPPAFAPLQPLPHLRHPPLAPSPVLSRPSLPSTPRASLDIALLRSRAAAVAAAGLLAFGPATVPGPLPWPSAPAPAHAGSTTGKGGGASFLSASGSVNKDAESLLRWALPIPDGPVRELQEGLEGIVGNTRKLQWGKIDAQVRGVRKVLNSGGVVQGLAAEKVQEGEVIVEKIKDAVPKLIELIAEKKTDEIVDFDRAMLRDVGRLEEMMVTGFPYAVPDEFKALPQLKGRATVEVVVRKDGDEPFDIEGTIYKEGRMTLVIDGYNAPVSAGSFVDLASKGFYDKKEVIRSDGFIIQSGKPDEGEGYVKKNGETRIIPLEVFAKGDKSPLYGVTLEDDGRGTSATTLPFTSFGTLAMAREEFEPNTASSQYFWFLFEPDLTPAGRNLMDGSWSVFGYTTDGQIFLKGLQRGDQIVSVTVKSGLENLIQPEASA